MEFVLVLLPLLSPTVQVTTDIFFSCGKLYLLHLPVQENTDINNNRFHSF